MAPLKGIPQQLRQLCVQRIHGWEVMAPLKEDQQFRTGRGSKMYPWLGGHGSIEGMSFG